MKKYLISTVFIVALVIGANNFQSNKIELSDLTLSNIEALANNEGMTAEEFYDKTGCRPNCDPNVVCSGKDGKKYNTFSSNKCSCGEH